MDSNYWGQINVKTEPIQNSQQTNSHQSQQTLPYYDTQPTIPYETQPTIPYENRQTVPFENPTTSTNPTQHNDENQQTVFENSEECSSEHSEDTREAFTDDGSEPEDEVEACEPPVHNENPIFQQFYDEQAPMPEFAEEELCDFWSKSENQIRLGMVFKNKEEVKHAVRMWSIAANREIYVTRSEPRLFHAVCYTRNTEMVPHIAGDPVCLWHVRAVKKINNNHWEIKRWVDTHNCYGSVQQNNNRCLTSRTISNHILHLIEEDIEYPVKNIRAFLKNSLNVDVSYPKAWQGRKKAIENIYGTWESNFSELPRYIKALQDSNPDTVVEWQHKEQSSSSSSSSQAVTFKYVFWAFGPAIKAFRLCQPVICVDGTHLKGSYKGKLLTAVTKDANNYVLPIAYAIVDEETVDSWCWFFTQLRYSVVYDRNICVISDRHKGIIHAMQHLPDWQEPTAYHRFCLRHVRSNFTKKFKTSTMKKLCWAIGSTTQKRKYLDSIEAMKQLDPHAWEYLNAIEKSKWCMLYDKNNRRWGWLTTNIAESLNNALRGARVLPIKACIDLTFNRCVQQFRKHSEIAMNCQTPLPPRIWNQFRERETHAQTHSLSVFDYTQGVYRVKSRFLPNEIGGNDYTVMFGDNTCTCGKWKAQRFPCSHAVAVIRDRGKNPANFVHKVYTTRIYRKQYHSNFLPLPHVAYWSDPGWNIVGDASKLTTARGRRRRGRRIRNEMDVRCPDEPR